LMMGLAGCMLSLAAWSPAAHAATTSAPTLPGTWKLTYSWASPTKAGPFHDTVIFVAPNKLTATGATGKGTGIWFATSPRVSFSIYTTTCAYSFAGQWAAKKSRFQGTAGGGCTGGPTLAGKFFMTAG